MRKRKRREEKRKEMLSQIMRLNSLIANRAWNPFFSSIRPLFPSLHSNLIDEVEEKKMEWWSDEMSWKQPFYSETASKSNKLEKPNRLGGKRSTKDHSWWALFWHSFVLCSFHGYSDLGVSIGGQGTFI